MMGPPKKWHIIPRPGGLRSPKPALTNVLGDPCRYLDEVGLHEIAF